MPLYDYQCTHCGKTFEVRATIQEKEAGLKLVCPKCGSHKARQKLTVALSLRRGKDLETPTCGTNSSSGCCG